MSLILHIDTATEQAIICLAENERIINELINPLQKNHASFVQQGIQQLMKESGIELKQLSAVAVTAGPGSYTGLRVGMASAKGICYALNLPLITLNTLEVMALSSMEKTAGNNKYYFCPMIDAGRIEVFTALYDENLKPLIAPCALILEPASFDHFSIEREIVFMGSGAAKFLALANNERLLHSTVQIKANALANLSLAAFNKNDFADLANSQPFYLKEFYTIAGIKK